MTKSHLLRSLTIFLAIAIFSQLVFSVSKVMSFQHSLKHAIHEVETRIALDVASLDLGDPVTQQSSNTASVQRYVELLNQHIDKVVQIPDFRVLSIAYSAPLSAAEQAEEQYNESHTFFPLSERHLYTEDYRILITTALPAVSEQFTPNWFGILLALFVSIFFNRRVAAKEQRMQQISIDAPKTFLRIDLHNKTLINLVTQSHVEIQNKPLCFFTALVDFCIHHPDEDLLHHKDVPNELLNRANKVFARLIELGHSKRKRPDFNANLEKTLSEVRASLDLVFTNQEEYKQFFYPPRAQGEGSRSKKHSYALGKIERRHVEIVGM